MAREIKARTGRGREDVLGPWKKVLQPAIEIMANALGQETRFQTADVPSDDRLLNALNETQRKYLALIDAEEKANHGWNLDPWPKDGEWDFRGPPTTRDFPFLEFNVNGTLDEKPGISVPRKWALSLKNPALIKFDGDSMEPAFSPGDILVVERETENIRDGVYAFLTPFGTTVSRVQTLPDDTVRLVPDNNAYQPRTASLEKLSVIGEVTGKISGVGP